MEKNGAFIKRLLATFKIEAGEHIAAITSGLIELEKELAAENRARVVETVFREAHSMKGAARSVNQNGIENVCQALEGIFAALKRGELVPDRPLFDLLHRSVDALGGLVSAIESGSPASDQAQARDLVAGLTKAAKVALRPVSRAGGGSPAEFSDVRKPSSVESSVPPDSVLSPVPADTVRISKSKLDSILLQAEGFLGVKQTIAQQSFELRGVASAFWELRKEWLKVRPYLQAAVGQNTKADGTAASSGRSGRKLSEFLESHEDRISRLHHALVSLDKSAAFSQRSVAMMVDGLLDDAKTVSMLPFSSLLELMPKIVRDLGRDQGKEIFLTTRGGEIEIDKRILDEMRDPLIHLVRNCIDHGIEKPEERTASGKKPAGEIMIGIALREGRAVELVVADDGRGINIEKIRGSAMKLGLLSREEAQEFHEERLIPLVFQSGVTTSPLITDISGRGLGLAIVRERVERLGGTVFCETQEGKGAAFRITLPLSLATFRGVLVRAGGGEFLLPTTSLERTLRVRKAEIKTVENRETIMIEGRAVPLVPLRMVLELGRPDSQNEPEFVQAAVLGAGANRIAFSVDDIVREQEMLVKGLGRQLARVRNISAATVLGNGKVVPILNVPDLMKSAKKLSSAVSARPAVSRAAEARKSVLVVEDSITSRTLLKNILEASGYDVQTAVDGLDAFATLKTGAFDLVVSDVDMPRMNGFDLTAKIRSDKKLAETPVILVTALESREDRERGVDVGANAYIVKSSFDKSNLLEAIKRLL